MKKASIALIGAICAAAPAVAQDIYKVETFGASDLNGTARFVGMGGAMSALGADLSVMSTNPAGIGLYRSSDFAVSASATIQPNATDYRDIGKARASFDQIGFVYAARMNDSDLRYINFGFNYHKSRNFKNYIGIDQFSTGGLSQSLEMLDLAYVNNGWLDLGLDADRELTTPLTNLGYDTQMLNPVYDETGAVVGYEPSTADSYNYRRVQWGSIQQYDFNVSFNVQDRFYGGLTFGLYNVNYNSFTDYGEALPDAEGGLHDYYMQNAESVSGTGFDIKLGFIARPFADSPFRVGLAFSTPVWYSLDADASLYMNAPYQNGNLPYTDARATVGNNSYNIRTPWKLNVSLATTVGRVLAVGAEYEYSNYHNANISYSDYYDDYFYGPWGDETTDHAQKEEIKRFMKPVHTFKIGAEARLGGGAYLRAGYNHVSAPFEKEAYLNLFTNSSSYYYSTNTDYVNLGSINRYTAGLGYRGKHFYADVAYQYQAQEGDLYAFHLPDGNTENNRLQAATVDLNRHNVLFTVGYKF